MIFERLIFENFRQFKGRQELYFSDEKDRNVTIVHAENGFGKTTILKGLLWVLYGQDGLMGTDGQPDDFEKPDRLLNDGLAASATDPNRVSSIVELTFKHEGARHILRRSLTLAQQNSDPRKAELSLEIMRDGQTYRQDNPQQRIQAIVPDGIRRLLFFNGERINYLAMERSSKEVSSAIRQMLGLQLLETTIADLNHQNVKGKLRADLREQPTSEEKRVLMDELDANESVLVEHRERCQQIRTNLVALNDHVDRIDKKLLANRKVFELQARRNRLSSELEDLHSLKIELSRQLSKLIAEDGYMLFTSELLKRGHVIVSKLRSDGKIPARVLNTFLKELLDSSKCICKRCLLPGTPERNAVEELMNIAGDADFNSAVGKLDHVMGLLEEGARHSAEKIKNLNIERLDVARKISDQEEELESIHQLISGKNDDEAKDLESKRNELMLKRDSHNAEIGRVEGKIEACEEEIGRLTQRIRQMDEQNESADLAQRRVSAVEDCANILQQILHAETEDLRPLLNDEISKHFRKIMDRDFWPELAEDFTLRVRKRIAGVEGEAKDTEIDAALSTGQRTVTSLVFIASLVALANRRSEIPTIVRGLSGSAYPIAIDSPFGSLSMFRRDVARYIPELAPQVFLLVSPTQYDGDVNEALESVGRVGRRYYLKFTGPTIPDRAHPDLIVGGQKIQQYYTSQDEEFTEICEL